MTMLPVSMDRRGFLKQLGLAGAAIAAQKAFAPAAAAAQGMKPIEAVMHLAGQASGPLSAGAWCRSRRIR